MWARHIEITLGIWLGISRFIFRYPDALITLKWNDGICMLLITLFSLLSYKERFRYCHLLNFLVGLWLIASVLVGSAGLDFSPHQNYMVVGLLLIMLSLVPSRTKEPPRAWVHFMKSFNGKDTE